MEEDFYTIAQVSEVIGAPKHMIRRIIKSDLVRNVQRRTNKYRVLNSEQVELVRTLYYLHRGGATMRDLRKYASLEYAGDVTIAERKAILETKKRQLWENLKDHIERKIEVMETTSKS